MLAKLFLKPSNLIVLDEPSNDLDVETLELLEHLLADYKGTVILISHDRELIENVVTRSLIFQGNGKFIDVAGGYADFERERASSSTLKPVFEQSSDSNASKGKAPTPIKHAVKPAKTVALSYKQKQELESLPQTISTLEADIAEIHEAMNSSKFYDDKVAADKSIKRAEELQAKLDAAYARWEELEEMAGG